MAILFITSKSLGGSGKVIYALADSLKDHVRCDLLYYPMGVSQDREIESAFRQSYHFRACPDFSPSTMLVNVLQVRDLLRSGQYEIVHSHTSLGGFIGRVGAFLAGRRHIKVVHTLHAFGAEEFTPVPQKWIYWLVEKGLDYITDAYIAPSQYTADYGRRTHLIGSDAKIRVIRNALPLQDPASERCEERKAMRSRLGIDSCEIVFLFCGRLERQKGVDILIRALALLPKKQAFRVLICGDGMLRDELLSFAEGLDVSQRLIWLGWQEDLSAYYSAADVYVMPSRWESFGLVFLEAMNYCLPIIATRTQAIPEVVEDGRSGLLAKREDATDLAGKMDYFLENEAARFRFGRAGKIKLTKDFCFRKFTKAHLDLYAELKPPAGCVKGSLISLGK